MATFLFHALTTILAAGVAAWGMTESFRTLRRMLDGVVEHTPSQVRAEGLAYILMLGIFSWSIWSGIDYYADSLCRDACVAGGADNGNHRVSTGTCGCIEVIE